MVDCPGRPTLPHPDGFCAARAPTIAIYLVRITHHLHREWCVNSPHLPPETDKFPAATSLADDMRGFSPRFSLSPV